jgi:hypothetical protein
VFPSLYVGVAVESFLVANGDINDFQVLFVSTKKQIEIAEGIEVSASMVKAFLILPPEHLATAERILYRLSQKPRENHTECLVRPKICKLHCSLIHGVDEPHVIGEFPFARREYLDELRQILRGHSQVGIQDHQDVTRGGTKAFDDGVAFASRRCRAPFVADLSGEQ